MLELIRSKIGLRLTVAFLAIALLIGFVSVLSFRQLNKVENPLTRDIPWALKEIETTSRLDSLAQRIRYFDQALTEAAKNYALASDRKWKYRYKNIEPQLEQIINEAIAKGDEDDKRSFSSVQKAKQAFVDLESRAIEAVETGDNRLAIQMLESIEYWQFKDEYKKALEEYVERRGKKHTETLVVSTTKVNSIVQETYQVLKRSMRLMMQITFAAVLLAVILGFLVSRSILNPIKNLQDGIIVIGKGDLAHKIQVTSKDEIGALATAFNEMTHKLEESYSILEDKVRERTTELAKKVIETENLNKSLGEAKSTLEQEKAKDEAILSSIGEGLIATNKEGKVIRINRQAERMFDWQMKDAIGKPVQELIRMEDEKGAEIPNQKQPIEIALASGHEVSAQIYFVKRDKSKFPAAVTVAPVFLDRQVIGTIAIARDITREKEIDQMKTEFVSTVSHELRTPLAIIKEFVALVQDGIAGEINEKQGNFLATARKNIDRLARIINDLLDISKIEAGKIVLNRSFVDVRLLIEEVLESYQDHFKNKGIMVQASLDKNIPKVYADRDKLIQVFTNLIGNASKFTPAGGLAVIVAINRGGEMEFSVADTGVGISAENLKKVFGKFEQFSRVTGSGAKGTGLGLAISKGLIEMHGGKIWVESEFGRGTKFTFVLPYKDVDQVFSAEVRQRFTESRKRGAPFAVIKLGALKTHLKSKDQNKDFEKTITQLTEILRTSTAKSKDVVLQCDGGNAIAAVVEADRPLSEALVKKIKAEVERVKVCESFELQTYVAELSDGDGFIEKIILSKLGNAV